MARPKKELQENAEGLQHENAEQYCNQAGDPIDGNTEVPGPSPYGPVPAKAPAKPNYNTEYAEYEVKVTPHFRRQPGGGNEIYKYTGKKGELLRDNIRIEKFRAEALSAKWYSRKHIFIEKGDDTTEFEFIVNAE